MTGYELHPEARSDLDEIWDYIAADSVVGAARFVDDILAKCRSLARFPHRGHRRPDLTGRPLRFILVRDHLIAYAPDRKPIWIIAVLHGHRDPRVLAAILRSRED